MMRKCESFREVISFVVSPTYLAIMSTGESVSLLRPSDLAVVTNWKAPFRLDNRLYIDNSIVWTNTFLDGRGIVFAEGEVRQFDGFVKHCFVDDAGLVSYQFTKFDAPGQSIKLSHDNTLNWSIDDFLTYLLIAQDYCIYVGNKRDQLVALDDRTGDVIWCKKLSESFSRFVGFSGDTVWLVIESGRILGVDVHSGEDHVNLLKPVNYPASWTSRIREPNFYLGEYTQLNPQQNKLFGLRDCYYWEIDLNSPISSYTLYDLEDHFRSFQMEANANLLPPFDSNRVFLGSIDRKGPTLGIFDCQQRQIVWTSELAKTDAYLPSVRQMAYVNKRLYVLDGSGTLHMFEEM